MKINIGTKKIAPFISVINTLFLLAVALTVSPYSYAAVQEKDGSLKTLVLDPEASCISSSCHKGMGKKKFVHSIGVDGKKCYTCHKMVKDGEHSFLGIPPVTGPLCAGCHAEEPAAPKEQEKESTEKKSLALDDIMDKMSEVEAPGSAEEQGPEPSELKRETPKVISKSEDMILHLPFAEGKCTECHDAHESNYKNHLKYRYPEALYARFSVEKYGLCLTNKCHKGLDYTFIEPRTLDLTLFRNGNLNLHYRHVNKRKGRSCSACHSSHGSKNPVLIKDRFQFGNRSLKIGFKKTDTGGECATTCHRKAEYDRYEPKYNYIKVSARPGTDATEEELKESKKRDLKQQAKKAEKRETQNK